MPVEPVPGWSGSHSRRGSILTVATADDLALLAHGDDLDKHGRPFVEHVRRVAEAVAARGAAPRLVVLALLHDSVEKGRLTWAEVAHLDLEPTLVRSLDAITERPGETERHYLVRAARDRDARVVKYHDLQDKIVGGRLDHMPAAEAARARAIAERRARHFAAAVAALRRCGR